MGWLIDPEEELVFVYGFDRTINIFEDGSDRLPIPAFAEAFQITVRQIFSWLES